MIVTLQEGVSLFSLNVQIFTEVMLIARAPSSRPARSFSSSGVEAEGLFRLSGNVEMIKAIKDRLDAGEDVDFMSISDSHTVAHLLKLWFRELPEVPSFSHFSFVLKILTCSTAAADFRTLRLLPGRCMCASLHLLSLLSSVGCVCVCVCGGCAAHVF